MMLLRNWLDSLEWAEVKRQRAVWRTRRNIDGPTNKNNNNSIILLPSFAKILEHTKYILAKAPAA